MGKEQETSAPASPQPNSTSENSSTLPAYNPPLAPPSPPPHQAEVKPDDVCASKEPESKPEIIHRDEDCFTPEEIKKFEKYEADYARCLIAKYFSGNTMHGDDVFVIEGQTIKASRDPFTLSFFPSSAESSSVTPSVAEVPVDVSNRNSPLKKSSS